MYGRLLDDNKRPTEITGRSRRVWEVVAAFQSGQPRRRSVQACVGGWLISVLRLSYCITGSGVCGVGRCVGCLTLTFLRGGMMRKKETATSVHLVPMTRSEFESVRDMLVAEVRSHAAGFAVKKRDTLRKFAPALARMSEAEVHETFVLLRGCGVKLITLKRYCRYGCNKMPLHVVEQERITMEQYDALDDVSRVILDNPNGKFVLKVRSHETLVKSTEVNEVWGRLKDQLLPKVIKVSERVFVERWTLGSGEAIFVLSNGCHCTMSYQKAFQFVSELMSLHAVIKAENGNSKVAVAGD